MRVERIEGQMSSLHNEQRSVSVGLETMGQVLSKHTELHKHQDVVNKILFDQVKENREELLKQQAWLREVMTSAGTVSVEQSQQQPRKECDRPGSRRNAPTHSGVETEKRPCPICGRLLGAKYLRSGKHKETKRCKKVADAAAAGALSEDEPEWTIKDVRTIDGHLLYCSEEEGEIPGDLQGAVE